MKFAWLIGALLFCGECVRADEPAKAAPVPYRLTDTHHLLVRVKINGKGPFNFIVDTGCPLLLISTAVGKQVGLKSDEKGWATLERLELEGGLAQTGVKARVETPFQIEGMNSLGLAGIELHGLMGYTVLAKYRLELDFTREQMAWTPLAFEPPQPQPLGGKTATGSVDMMASVVRFLSLLIGTQTTPAAQPRGFFGFELLEKEGAVLVASVLPHSPAAQAGLKAGDRIDEVEGRPVANGADVLAGASKVTAGRLLRLTIGRGAQKQTLRITAGEGL
jgi:serine protease DegQ